MATIKTTFVSKDGKEFDNAADCDLHEKALDLDAHLTAYVDQASFKDTATDAGLKVAKTRLKKVILSYLIWAEKNPVDAQGSAQMSLDGLAGEASEAVVNG